MMINWTEIDTVLLDMDGTLLDLHYDNYFWATYLPQRYAEIKCVPLIAARKQLHTHIQSLEGTLNWYCLEYWSQSLGIDMGLLKAEPDIIHKIKTRPHTQVFLEFLQVQNKKVWLVTNAHPIGLNIKLKETGIGKYFDQIVTSHQFQSPKEEQIFWHSLQAHLPFDSARTLFIDDNVSVLQAAKEYGIAHNIGIHQPDSQIHRRLEDVTAIHDFNEII